MEKTTTIKEVKEIKSGVGAKGAWTLWSVIDADNVRYGTFQAEPWRSHMAKGDKVTITYEEKQNGKYTNRNIIDPQKKEKAVVGNDAWEKLFAKLNLMDEKINKIGKMVGELAPAEETPEELKVEEIVPEDIPF